MRKTRKRYNYAKFPFVPPAVIIKCTFSYPHLRPHAADVTALIIVSHVCDQFFIPQEEKKTLNLGRFLESQREEKEMFKVENEVEYFFTM